MNDNELHTRKTFVIEIPDNMQDPEAMEKIKSKFSSCGLPQELVPDLISASPIIDEGPDYLLIPERTPPSAEKFPTKDAKSVLDKHLRGPKPNKNEKIPHTEEPVVIDDHAIDYGVGEMDTTIRQIAFDYAFRYYQKKVVPDPISSIFEFSKMIESYIKTGKNN